jgi:hypothetical protein
MATDPKTLVERFYGEVWNRGDETVAREILQPALQFRGSLGVERQGLTNFSVICARCTRPWRTIVAPSTS